MWQAKLHVGQTKQKSIKLVTEIICLVTKIVLKTTYGSYTFCNERAALSGGGQGRGTTLFSHPFHGHCSAATGTSDTL